MNQERKNNWPLRIKASLALGATFIASAGGSAMVKAGSNLEGGSKSCPAPSGVIYDTQGNFVGLESIPVNDGKFTDKDGRVWKVAGPDVKFFQNGHFGGWVTPDKEDQGLCSGRASSRNGYGTVEFTEAK